MFQKFYIHLILMKIGPLRIIHLISLHTSVVLSGGVRATLETITGCALPAYVYRRGINARALITRH